MLVSMDGRGRALDNVFVERVRKVFLIYEYIYFRRCSTVQELEEGLSHYIGFYNQERVHQSLGYSTPRSVYHT